MRFIRSIVQKTRQDRIRNEEMRNRLKIEKLQDVFDGNRIRWFGHVMSMQDTRLPKKIFTLELTGRRSIGRARTRWRDQVKQDLERRGLSWTDVTRKSLWNDREHWRRISNTRPP